jgi:hypothetical protein
MKLLLPLSSSLATTITTIQCNKNKLSTRTNTTTGTFKGAGILPSPACQHFPHHVPPAFAGKNAILTWYQRLPSSKKRMKQP